MNSNNKSKQTLHHVKASTQYKREHKADYGREKIEILYEDHDIMVIEKPCGLLSVPYPGSKARTALELIEKIMRGRGDWTSSHRPFTVHRLDRDTSGVMVFALTEAAQHTLMSKWHSTVTERLYHAVAENPRNPQKQLPDAGTINAPLAQNAYHVGYVPKDNDDFEGQKPKTVEAVTHYKVVCRGKTHTLFELSLDTGKKNQIRAHLSSMGYPLAGDENYRAHTDPFHRLALHARTLEFAHPVTGKKMHFEVPEDAQWLEYVQKGNLHPEMPVWEKAKIAEKQESRNRPAYNGKIESDWNRRGKKGSDDFEGMERRRISAKERSHSDFISLGKAHRK